MSIAKKILPAFLLVLLCLGIQVPDATAANVIRFATVAPDGTSWLREMQALAVAVKKDTAGEVELKIYSSSKMGDELDVIRKMRSGQVHAGAFSGLGLGAVQPAIRVLELPFLFQSNEEIDYVQGKVFDQLSKRFAEKGMVLLGTSEAGNVHIYSKDPIRKKADLHQAKMWLWEGDPLAKAFYDAAKVTPIALPITDVITGLQTGMINGVYSPPMALIGFQWWTKVSYMTSPNLNLAVGGMLITKAKWATISPQHQKIVMQLAKDAGRKITTISRADNLTSVTNLKKNGMQMVEMDAAAKQEFDQLSEDLGKNLAGKLYDKAIYDQVRAALAEYRAGKRT